MKSDVVNAVARFVRAPNDADFVPLALRAFAFQFERVEPYRRWCERAGKTPATVRHWREIPWVPASAMKSVDLHAAPGVVTFRSSGTTAGERRSVHHHPFPDLYRLVIECSFPGFCLPRVDRSAGTRRRGAGTPMLSLIPRFEPVRESSLSFMVDHVLATFGGEGSANTVGVRGIDLDAAAAWLRARETAAEPCLVLATALALDQCLRGLDEREVRVQLAPGSALFVTGGFKTRQAELTLEDLLARLEHRLAIAPSAVVQEYGMTELTSQAYTRALLGGPLDLFVGSPWMRIRVLDPRTLEEAAAGGTGLLALFDLANLGSVLHLLTEDLARVEDGGFRLLGRASGAELRGCSLTAEELEAPPTQNPPWASPPHPEPPWASRGAMNTLRAAEHLHRHGSTALASLDDDRLAAAFLDTVVAFRDPASPERRGLDPALRESTSLSAGVLDASLTALLEGFTATEVRSVLVEAHRTSAHPHVDSAGGPHLIVLAANLPGIALAPLLASLAVRRPAILKSSSREPHFAPAFAAALAAREPALGDAVAALSWRGGDGAIEAPLLDVVDRVVVYGGAKTIVDLERRAGDRVVAFGPKASVALVARHAVGASLDDLAAALARDVALFDQRGCLSLQAVYTDGDADALAAALARALDRAAARWPPAELSTAEAAALRMMREEAAFLGSTVLKTPLERATVVVDRRALFLPSPGHRTVRVHPVADLDRAIAILRPHGARLQGAAVAGDAAGALSELLAEIGVSYVCMPGRLQSPGASWRNGGVDLVDALAGR